MTETITPQLASFIAAPETLPDKALSMMRLSLLDWAACGIAGIDEPVARILREQALSDGGAERVSVIGTSIKLPAKAAALVNGATSHALDYDDTHFAHIGHPSVAVIPAALAIAELTGASGEDFLNACLIGVETSIRVGVWLGRDHYQAGFHQTGTAGTFGATAAACHLLGLDPIQTGHALGLAATRASGLKSQFGTMGKPYNAGIAASNGVETAQLAAAGFVSNPLGLETSQGFGDTHAGQAISDAMKNLGQDFLFETISHKFHACCHGTHAALECIADLKPQLNNSEVQSIQITTHPRWLTVCNIPEPQTGLEAKFSYRLTAAMALSGYDTGALSTFSDQLCHDPVLTKLRNRVEVVTDSKMPETATVVEITTTDGQSVLGETDLNAPIQIDVLQEKLQRKSASIVGSETAQNLWAAISPQDGPNLNALTQAFPK